MINVTNVNVEGALAREAGDSPLRVDGVMAKFYF